MIIQRMVYILSEQRGQTLPVRLRRDNLRWKMRKCEKIIFFSTNQTKKNKIETT